MTAQRSNNTQHITKNTTSSVQYEHWGFPLTVCGLTEVFFLFSSAVSSVLFHFHGMAILSGLHFFNTKIQRGDTGTSCL